MIEQKKVMVSNFHGEKLVGILHDTGSSDLVIICHGFRASKDRSPMVNLAVALEKEGMSCFRFDFAGNGESEGSFQYGNYRREAEDLRSVVKYFQENKYFVIAVIGHSKGGNAVLIYASLHEDVKIVINISGRFNLKRGIEGRLGKNFQERIDQDGFIDVKNRRGRTEYRVTRESLMDRLTTDVEASCRSIPPKCRVLTVHGEADEIVEVEDAVEFSKNIHAPNNLLILEGADHEFTKHQTQLASAVVNFVKLNLHREEAATPDPSSPACATNGHKASRL